MNEELTKIKEEMNAQKAVYIGKMQDVFKEQVKKLFNETPKLNSFEVSVNNHEFNDGDATYFSIYSDEPNINGAEYQYEGIGHLEESGLTKEEWKDISGRINEVFDAFDGEDLETMYSEEYDSIEFSREQ